MSFAIHDAAPATPIVGRVLDKHLSDELGEELTLVVDGIDGRTHHVAGMDAARVAEARIGSNRLIDRSLNIQPTLTDRPGLPFTLILNRDLALTPWKAKEPRP